MHPVRKQRLIVVSLVVVLSSAAVGLVALFFASPLLGTAAILLSAVGIIAGAFATSRAKA